MQGFRFAGADSAFLIFILFIVSCLLFLYSYRKRKREVPRGLYLALNALRIAALVLIVFCLLEPKVTVSQSESRKKKLIIALDNSLSMSIVDCPDGAARLDYFKKIFGDNNSAARLKRAFDVEIVSFSKDVQDLESIEDGAASGRTTDYAAALTAFAARMAGKGGALVVVSDGARQDTGDLDGIVDFYRRNFLPVYTVGAGRADLEDLAIAEVTAEKTVTIDTTVTVRCRIQQRGFTGRKAVLTVRAVGGEPAAQRVIALASETEEVTLDLKPTTVGLVTYEVAVAPFAEELVRGNNRTVFAIESFKRKLRVLYMEGTQYKIPRRDVWEFQYLVQALEEDKDVEVTPLFRDDLTAAKEAGVYYIAHPTKGFPKKRKDVLSYDVIISSDIDREFFTDGDLKNIRDFVADFGGGFVMIGGWTSFGSGGYDDSIIDKMIPVDMLGRSDGHQDNVNFKVTVPKAAMRHPLMQLSKDGKENERIWKELPSFYGFNPVVRAKPAATVLALHPWYEPSFYGKQVILAVQQYGKGRSMAFTTDTTAGWGKDFETKWGEYGDNRHYVKFWKNAVRWLSEFRRKAPNKRVQINADRLMLEEGEKARVTVRVYDEKFTPLADAAVSLDVTSPSGAETVVRALPDPLKAGVYRAEVPLAEVGEWNFTASGTGGGALIDTDSMTLAAAEATREFRNAALKEGFLRKLALATGGEYLAAGDSYRLPAMIEDSFNLAQKTKETHAWNNLLFYCLILTLLAAEWFLRKKQGLP